MTIFYFLWVERNLIKVCIRHKMAERKLKNTTPNEPDHKNVCTWNVNKVIIIMTNYHNNSNKQLNNNIFFCVCQSKKWCWLYCYCVAVYIMIISVTDRGVCWHMECDAHNSRNKLLMQITRWIEINNFILSHERYQSVSSRSFVYWSPFFCSLSVLRFFIICEESHI